MNSERIPFNTREEAQAYADALAARDKLQENLTGDSYDQVYVVFREGTSFIIAVRGGDGEKRGYILGA